MKKRKICFVITSKIHYSRNKLILDELKKRDDVELQIIVGGSAILERYGDTITVLDKDGFKHDAKIIMTLEGGSPVSMAKTAGLGITEFATAFDNLQPDVVIVRGDRYEVLSAAIAAAYLNIPVAHIEGGDVTGTIDESVRHAVTKIAHIHFPTNDEAKERIIRMGEDPDYIFNFGSPDLEFVARNNYEADNKLINELGVGSVVDLEEPFLMVMQHPVTTEFGKNKEQVMHTLEAIDKLKLPTIWFWPNVDAGTDEISNAIRTYREKKSPKHVRFIKYIAPDQFVGLLKKAACLVGNSSSGIKESSYLGVPVVNIGTRQNGRYRGRHVVDVGYDSGEIEKGIKTQIDNGRHLADEYYYKENTGKNIAETLASIDLYIQKKFVD